MIPNAKNIAAPIGLSEKTLSQLPDYIQKPTYDRNALSCGVLHMSVGGFHRSHQAMYLDDYLGQAQENWMICGVGLMPQDLQNLEALKKQDCLYSVLMRSPTEDSVRVVGSMKKVLHAPSQAQDVIDQIANPDIKIVSLTVTEKGYYYNDKRALDLTNPVIHDEVKLQGAPKTFYGYLVHGLRKRRNNNVGPVTIMCCDNLPGNGHITEKLLKQFVSEADASLLSWINTNVSFPNGMVDRITPVTTQVVKDTLANNFGVDDNWPVVCEDYIQWVLEDKFIAGRPQFENVGIQMVEEVEPYEKMKVRLLNGSHSALSYISYLMGYRAVDKAMADPLIATFVRRYMDENITGTLSPVPGIDLTAYKDKLISRFANPSISDQVQRLAEDGSQKIRNAIVPPLEFQLENNRSIKWIALALAGWWRYLRAVDEATQPIEVKDPMKDALTAKASLHERDPIGLLSFQEIFGNKLMGNTHLIAEMSAFLDDFYTIGARKTLEKALK